MFIMNINVIFIFIYILKESTPYLIMIDDVVN